MATSKARKLKTLSKLAKRDGDSCTIRVLVALNVRSHWVMIAFGLLPISLDQSNGTGMVCMGQRRWPKPGVDPSGAERTGWALR